MDANDVSLSVRVFKPDAQNPVARKDLTLVLVHQYSVLGGCQGLLKGMAAQLAGRGFTVVTFDMRGAGRSTGRPSLTGFAEVQDVIAVCKWATEHINAHSILLVGNSAGQSGTVFQFNFLFGYPFPFFGCMCIWQFLASSSTFFSILFALQCGSVTD